MKNKDKIIKINIKTEYSRPIYGLGEIYEVGSVNWKRIGLLKKYHQGEMYLSSNKNHSNRGYSLSELRHIVKNKYKLILDSGYVDCPPWSSDPRGENSINQVIYNNLVVLLAKIFFRFYYRFEFFTARPKTAHMVYVLAK